ncbi:MAG TPA: ATP phosphoribosyltransferase [Dehalococcoidia bacterium]
MIKVALPTGDLRRATGELLERLGFRLEGYEPGSRLMRPRMPDRPDVALRIFREKDIPIQIALGNYDVGICGAVWIEELLRRYPSDAVVRLRPLGYGVTEVYAATSPDLNGGGQRWNRLADVRIVSEFEELAEAFAIGARLPRYRVLPVHGATEAYLPEDADVAILAATGAAEVRGKGMEPLFRLFAGGAWLIAHRRSVQEKDLAAVLRPFMDLPPAPPEPGLAIPRLPAPDARTLRRPAPAADVVRLAVPDGHQQPHAVAALAAAGFRFEGYDEEAFVRRPRSGVPGLEVKVVRPQDMPQHVALRHFDLAITGRDVLLDHLYAFPASPVAEVVDLGRSPYDLYAVVDGALPAETLEEAVRYWRGQGRGTIRVASEFPHVADHYARHRHLGRYQVIPIAGASEGFVPEDADLLIEGSETGRTIRANNLKVIDTVFRSTNCLIAHRGAASGRKAALMREIVERFRQSVGAAV